jgi:uncharacterized protein (TIGR03437 family)
VPQANVSFVQLDTTTKGNWKSVYGGDGYNNVNDWMSYPSYAQVIVTGYTNPTWMSSTTDVRAVQRASNSTRIAARLESSSFFTIDLNITDGQSHPVALYSLDWDGNNRSQRVDLFDYATNVLLDSRTISSFNGGQYLVWNIRGRVRITVNKIGAKTAVVSGLYFGGPVAAPTPTPTPTPTPSPSPGSNNAPSVSLTSPANGSNFITSTNITLNATATDSDGSVSRVEFYRSGVLIGSSTASPYSVVWSNAAKGTYSLTAKAFDNQGASTTSGAVSVTVNSSPNSVNRAKGKANNLVTEVNAANYGGAADSPTEAAITLSNELAALTTEVEEANRDYLSERSSFVAVANRVDAHLSASVLFSKANASLALRAPSSPSIRNNLYKIIAHLAMAEDLMLYGVISSSTSMQALQAKARVNISVGLATSGYGVNSAAPIARLSIGNIMGTANVTPMTSKTAFGTIATNGNLPYELGGLSVSVGGVTVPLLYVSPWRITFVMPAEVQNGSAEIIVASQDGYVCSGVALIESNKTRIMTTSDDDNGVAVAINPNKRSGDNLEVTSAGNFGSDKRTRLNIYATGISGSAANSNAGNDLTIGGTVRANFAESVTVEARLSDGRTFNLPVEFAGVQGTMPGLDQVTVVLIPQLQGAGRVELTLIVGGERSNAPAIVVQ